MGEKWFADGDFSCSNRIILLTFSVLYVIFISLNFFIDLITMLLIF